MIANVLCKFCHGELQLEVDDSYAELGDPYKLLKLAACNRCADFRAEQLAIVREMRSVCLRLEQKMIIGQDRLEAAREYLERRLKRYIRLVADHREVPVPDWDGEILGLIMQSPGYYIQLIRNMHHAYFDTPQQAKLI